MLKKEIILSSSQRVMIALSLMFGLLFLTSPEINAQGLEASGTKALETATTTFTAYIPLVRKLIYAIAGVIALVGAISVYIKMNNEEQDVKKSIMMIIGACVFLVIAAETLPLFFKS